MILKILKIRMDLGYLDKQSIHNSKAKIIIVKFFQPCVYLLQGVYPSNMYKTSKLYYVNHESLNTGGGGLVC